MPADKLPEFALNLAATDELQHQSRRTGLGAELLRVQSEVIAFLDPSRDADDFILDPKHIVKAAEYLSNFLAESKSDYSVFLSYSTKDEDFVRELEADLRAVGISCFLAPLSIKPGASWPEEIWQAIRGCRVFVLVVTTAALRSKWCLLEVGAAIGLKKMIISVLRHSTRIPDVLKSVQALKVQTKKQQADLVMRLKQLCSS
jgi:hypothetical protein